MPDKFGRVLRIETVANDVSFSKHRRKVDHRDGTATMKNAHLPKRIYSLPILYELMAAANRRYLDFLSALDDDSSGVAPLDKVARPVPVGDRTYRGFNLLHGEDVHLFLTLARGEFNLNGFQNRNLRRHLVRFSGSQMGRALKRLRTNGLIKKIGHSYKYRLGKRVVAAALSLRECAVIPALAS